MKKRSESNRLGQFIYKAREDKGISTPKLAEAVGLNAATMRKIQLGEIQQPRPAILASIAKELGVSSGEIYAIAGYRTEDEMPDLRGWANVKYRELPDEAVAALQGHLDYLLHKHSLDALDQTNRKEET